ncbi:hypothetical protein CDAR_318241 [Caerostris darwini]|uniref:Uncharacterized protein n=1 Tax=Caerostris darwini TaxID=1538125 RepID=A0AAV4T8U7_9ARAC|nr:hypothetical protein CDAR_318241 [Caerostris darwini]
MKSTLLNKENLIQRWGDGANVIYYYSTSRRPPIWERTRPPTYTPFEKPASSNEVVVFYCILGIGFGIFVGLLVLCRKARNSPDDSTASTVHPPPLRSQTDNMQRNERGINVNFVNSAYSSSTEAVTAVDFGERPPDYATVTLNDFGNYQTPAFPAVVTCHQETPPPKYEDHPPSY